MSEDAIDRILKVRRAQDSVSSEDAGKFFSVLNADGLAADFLEFQFRNGLRSCFPYSDLTWFSWDPEAGCLDLEFGGFTITIKGRGLYEGLFHGIRNKRVVWVREADTQMQDHDGIDAFIEEIDILPPRDFAENEGEEAA